MASIGVFTIASKNYLSYVRALMNSVARFHPDYKLFLCLADRVDDYFDTKAEIYDTVQADQLGIENFEDMTVRYDIMEFNTAVKPFMFKWLFNNTDLDVVIYLDPDIRVYSRFDQLESVLEKGASVVLTPHITKPLEDERNPNDYNMLQAGVYNLGFIAARRFSETLDFMDWWGRRLSSQCVVDFEKNLFVDQKWCDLAPCFLEKFSILKDPGYNVAYWNLAHRHVVISPNGVWKVNEAPLVFFHFSGVHPEKRNVVSKHQDRFKWDDISECQPLFNQYLDELILYGWKESSKWPYAYASISENLRLNPLIRRLYRSLVLNPIDLDSKKMHIETYLLGLCNQKADDIFDNDVWITSLMKLVYQLRPDVQAAFNLSNSDGRRQFVNWFEVSGEREYGLPPSVTHQEYIKEINSQFSRFKKKK